MITTDLGSVLAQAAVASHLPAGVRTFVVDPAGTLLSPPDQGPAPPPIVEGGTIPLGRLLFTQYLLPFEIVSVLLLVAMVGVVLLSKKDLQ